MEQSKKETKTENKPETKKEVNESKENVKTENKSETKKEVKESKDSKEKVKTENKPKTKKEVNESTEKVKPTKIFGANHLFSECIIVNRMITKYMQIGFEAPLSKTFSPVFPNNKKGVIFLIPGFLGAPEYYTDFILKVYEAVKIPTVIVSHGNHIKSKAVENEFDDGHQPYNDTSKEVSNSLDWKHMHGIWGQVNHKLVFISRFIGNVTPLIIIGHSIGAEMAFRILKKNSYLSIIRIIVFLPLFEHVDCSPMASRYMTLLKICGCFVHLFTRTIGMCPQSFQKRIVPVLMNQGFSIPESCQEAATHFSYSVCANAAIELFKSAVETVPYLPDLCDV